MLLELLCVILCSYVFVFPRVGRMPKRFKYFRYWKLHPRRMVKLIWYCSYCFILSCAFPLIIFETHTFSKLDLDTGWPTWGVPDVSSRLYTQLFTRNPILRSGILKSCRNTTQQIDFNFSCFYFLTRSGGYIGRSWGSRSVHTWPPAPCFWDGGPICVCVLP